MKNRMNVWVVAAFILLAGAVWSIGKFHGNKVASIATAAPVESASAPAPGKTPDPVPPAVQEEQPAAPAPRTAGANEVSPAVDTDPVHHVAQPGETLSGLAQALLGKDTPANREAIINANASLKSDPDKLIAGKTYRIPSAAEVASAGEPAPALAAVESHSPKSDANEPEPAPELKYTAVAGDTLTHLAEAFLGSGAQSHKDEIVNANEALQENPDRVVAGKAYRIPAPNGLSAASNAGAAESKPLTETEPDSDDVIAADAPRSLRYVARPGDTVTTMAIQLLGSDKQETRDAIIAHNPSLKKHPDRVIAGQAYWIPAPSPGQ